MLVLACGSRSWVSSSVIQSYLRRLPSGTVLMHGGARGADVCAGQVAQQLGFAVRVFLADWRRFGRSAGFRRNELMLSESPDLVIAFWDGRSRGTAHMLALARCAGVRVVIVREQLNRRAS